MTDALKTQHGGSHYKNKAIQPVEFGMANRYDPCIFSAMKYVSRHAEKHGEEDLRKGEHFVFLRLATNEELPYARTKISPKYYCEANGMGEIETKIIIALHDWATGNYLGREFSDADRATELSNMFNALIASAYPH